MEALYEQVIIHGKLLIVRSSLEAVAGEVGVLEDSIQLA